MLLCNFQIFFVSCKSMNVSDMPWLLDSHFFIFTYSLLKSFVIVTRRPAEYSNYFNEQSCHMHCGFNMACPVMSK